MAIVELPLICFFGKNAHFKYQKVANLHIFDIKEEIEAYKRNTQKLRKGGKTTVNC